MKVVFLLLVAAPLVAGCDPTVPDGSIDVDEAPGPDATRYISVEIEVPDLGVGIEGPESSLSYRGLGPSLRVGVDVVNLLFANDDDEAFYDALREATALEMLSSGGATIVPTELVDESDFSVHDVYGNVHADVAGSPRLGAGYSIVPVNDLVDGWYRVRVGVPPVPESIYLTESAGFGNRRVGSTIVSRFYVGEARVLTRLIVSCGSAEVWSEIGLEAGQEQCHYSFATSGQGGNNAGNVFAVSYDGIAVNCILQPVLGSGQRLHGLVCPVPADGVDVAVVPGPEAGVDTSGDPVNVVDFVYDSSAEGDLELALLMPPGLVSHVYDQVGDFGLTGL